MGMALLNFLTATFFFAGSFVEAWAAEGGAAVAAASQEADARASQAVPKEKLHVLILIDNSTAMAGAKLDVARRAAEEVVSGNGSRLASKT